MSSDVRSVPDIKIVSGRYKIYGSLQVFL